MYNDMMNHTMTLQELYKDWFNYEGFSIFPPEYVDNVLTNNLNKKILNHFWLREIGVETPDRFIFNFQTSYLEHIDNYIVFKKAMARDFEIFINNKTTTDIENITKNTIENVTGNNASDTTTSTNTSNNITLDKRGLTGRGNLIDTEQIPYTSTLQNENYSTSRTWEKADNKVEDTTTAQNENENIHTSTSTFNSTADVEGMQAIISKSLTMSEIEMLDIFIRKYPNIDLDFIKKLEENFMMVY